MSGAGPAAAAAVLSGYGGCAEDNAALFRARITSEEAEQRRLLVELKRLQHEVEGLADAGVPVATLPAGCSEPVLGDPGTIDTERFVLLVAFHHTAPVAGVAVNEQGVVATAAWDGHAPLFDLPQWHDLGYVDTTACGGATSGGRSSLDSAGSFAETASLAAAFMPSAPQMLGLAVAGNVQMWQVVEGKCTWQSVFQHTMPISSIDFHSAQGILGCAADDGQAPIWDVKEQKLLRTLPSSNAELTGCRFMGGNDYQFLMATTGLDGDAQVWDLRRPMRVESFEGLGAATCLDCHAGSHLLVVGRSDGWIGTWDMRTWRELQSMDVRAHTNPRAYTRSLAISPCGTFLAAGCIDGELLVFDVHRESRVFKILHHRDCVNALAWGGRTGWTAAPNFLACASLDGSWSCWGHSGRPVTEAEGC